MTQDELWQREWERLHKCWERAERRIARFDEEDGDYPSVVLHKPATCVTTPCCNNDAWHYESRLHQCSICKKYYYVILEEDDDVV
jgi:hypothetical protein